MRAGDKVDARYALIAQTQHYLTQARYADALPALAAANFPVLTEYTAEIAAGKEYRPGAAAAAYARLLAEMRRGSRDARQERAAAHARGSIIAARSAASAGTQIT